MDPLEKGRARLAQSNPPVRYGRIVVSVFVHRNGLASKPLPRLPMNAYSTAPTVQKPLSDWNTGFIYFVLNGENSQDWEVPNLLANDEMMRLRWSPRWMDSQLYYRGRVGETLAQLNFTWPMDGKSYEERYSFFDGVVILKYSGIWEG